MIFRIGLALCMALALGQGAAAQSLFSPVARINDSIVTRYELDQRTQFLTLFNTPGDVRQVALDRLIEERLQNAAVADNGITVSEEAVERGMDEFAARAELTREEFIEALRQNGVEAETFRDFVRAGVGWRELIRTRFGDEARPAPAEIDARLIETGTVAGVRVLLTEVILPVGDEATVQASMTRGQQLSRITDIDEFRAAARRFSQGSSRPNSGDLDWLPVGALPAELQDPIERLRPGQTSAPLVVPGGIAVFHMRDREDLPAVPSGQIAVDYARLALGTPDALDRALARADTCDDLHGLAEGRPEGSLVRESLRAAALPAGLAALIADMDENEIRPLPGDPGTVVMLCARKLDTPFAPSREAVFQELNGQNLNARALRYLAELQAAATITRSE